MIIRNAYLRAVADEPGFAWRFPIVKAGYVRQLWQYSQLYYESFRVVRNLPLYIRSCFNGRGMYAQLC